MYCCTNINTEGKYRVIWRVLSFFIFPCQMFRINRRKKKSGRSDIYDIRTDKNEARMKYGRGSEEFKKYKQELKDAKKSARQERRDNS